MALDYTSLLYSKTLGLLGVQALLTVEGFSPLALDTLDKTAGIVVGGNAEVQTVMPAAIVSVADLAAGGIDPDAVDDATLLLSGKTWTVKSHQVRQSPSGEADGTLYLLLSA